MTDERYASLRMTFSSLINQLYGEPVLNDMEWATMMRDPDTRKDIDAAVAGVEAHQLILKKVLETRQLKAQSSLN